MTIVLKMFKIGVFTDKSDRPTKYRKEKNYKNISHIV